MISNKAVKFIHSWLTTLAGKIYVAIVVVPTILTISHLYFIAPDRYISSAQLSIYDSTVLQQANDIFSSLGLPTGQPNNDLQLLKSYLISPSLVELADSELDLEEHFVTNSDFLFGLDEDSPFESFHSFYLEHAYTHIDSATGLLEITTEAYSAEFSLALNKFLVTEGERFINQLNQDVARSEMGFAEEEIARSLKILREEQLALTNFQGNTNLASPVKEGESIIGIVYSLEASLAKAKASLNETLTYLSIDSPQAKSLNAKISSLESQITEQKLRVTGSSSENNALSILGAEYNELLFKAELAKVVYETSVSSYELARNQATKQLKHLLVSSEPKMAETSAIPERGYWSISFHLIYLAIYGITMMITRSVLEHLD